MSTITISLPDSVTRIVEERVAIGEFKSVSDYVRELIHRDMQAREVAELETKIIEGLQQLDRGEECELTDKDWEELDTEIENRSGKDRA